MVISFEPTSNKQATGDSIKKLFAAMPDVGEDADFARPHDIGREVLYSKENGTIPHAVISAIVDGNSPIEAWREYLGFSPAEIAARLDISQAAFAEIETAVKPRQVLLKKVAQALGLTVAQLAF